jgi:hypothetical protein
MLSSFILLNKCGYIMACSLLLVACGLLLASWYPEAWSLKLLAIDPDPWAMLSPSIAHDL